MTQKGRPKKEVIGVRKQVTIYQHDIDALESIGNNNASAGIAKLCNLYRIIEENKEAYNYITTHFNVFKI